jgi:hypothetical protein
MAFLSQYPQVSTASLKLEKSYFFKSGTIDTQFLTMGYLILFLRKI